RHRARRRLAGARPPRHGPRDRLRGVARRATARTRAPAHARAPPRAQRARRARGRRGPRDPLPHRRPRARGVRRHPPPLRGEGRGAGRAGGRRLRPSPRGDPRHAARRTRGFPAPPGGRLPAAPLHEHARPPPHRRRAPRPAALGGRRPRHPLAMSDTLPAALMHTIRARLGDRARPGEPLARYTSFRIGGPADLLVLPDTADELAHVLATTAAFGVRLTLLAGGSNVLVGDGAMRGVVVKLRRGFARITWNGTQADRESARAARGGSRAGVELG